MHCERLGPAQGSSSKLLTDSDSHTKRCLSALSPLEKRKEEKLRTSSGTVGFLSYDAVTELDLDTVI
jgi:hypothetical protein